MTGSAQSPAAKGRWTHTHTVTLAELPARAFAALTNPVDLRQWFAEH
jgi:uncharacterized protein YndB with AHSA1/START domain